MNKDNEEVLVVPADVIFQRSRWQGLMRDNLEYYLDVMRSHYQFKRRGDVEHDPSFQQIIPYIIFSCGDDFFIYRYLPKAGESRLVDTYQIGIGGHINEIDGNGADILHEGMMREWAEEVDYKGSIVEKRLVGLLADDSRPVEAVHLGLVYHFIGDSPHISIRETDKMQGELVAMPDIAGKIQHNAGIWIKLVYRDYLAKLHDPA